MKRPSRRFMRWTCLLLVALSILALTMPAGAQTLTLADAVDSALAQHPAALAAQARVDGAKAGLDAARAQLVPMVSSTVGVTQFDEPMVVAPLHALDLHHPPAFDRTLVQGQIGLQYTLFDGGVRGARIRGAGAVEHESEAARDAVRTDLIVQVTRAYLSTLTAAEVLDAATQQVAALEAETERARQNLAQGTAARVEVLRTDAAMMDARAQAATAEAQSEVTRRGLARLMGVDPASLRDRVLLDVTFTRAPQPATSVESPRVAEARRAAEVARARVDQEKADRMPSLGAVAGLHEYGTATGGFESEWQAGLKISWPVFTGGARSAAIRQARAGDRAAQESLRLVRLQVENDVDEASAAVTEADARTQALEASVRLWQEVARIEALGLREGSGVQTDLLSAQAGLFRARAGYARARHDAILARLELARAQGSLDRNWLDEALEVRQ